MTRKELVTKVAKSASMDAKTVERIILHTLSEITESLVCGEEVYLRGFGTFKLVERKEKPARLITEGKQIIVPAHNIPVLKFCKPVKNRIKE